MPIWGSFGGHFHASSRRRVIQTALLELPVEPPTGDDEFEENDGDDRQPNYQNYHNDDDCCAFNATLLRNSASVGVSSEQNTEIRVYV